MSQRHDAATTPASRPSASTRLRQASDSSDSCALSQPWEVRMSLHRRHDLRVDLLLARGLERRLVEVEVRVGRELDLAAVSPPRGSPASRAARWEAPPRRRPPRRSIGPPERAQRGYV